MSTAAVVPSPAPRRPLKGLRWYVCGLLFLVTFINYVDRVSLGAMNEKVLRPAIGWDDAEFGWINFSFSLSYALMFAFAGRFLDKVGVRKGLAIGVAVWSVAAIGHALAETVLGFAIARFVLGLGEATNFPAAIKAIAEWFPQRERALATSIFNTGTNFGAMAGAIGGMFMQLIGGGTLQWLGTFTPLFVISGVLHPISWLTIRLLTGRTIAQVDVGHPSARRCSRAAS